MKFILPRLFGLAVIAGLASLLLAVIAKALLAIAITGAIIYFITRRLGRHQWNGFDRPHGMYGRKDFRQMAPGRYDGFYSSNDVVPVHHAQRSTGIIPIN